MLRCHGDSRATIQNKYRINKEQGLVSCPIFVSAIALGIWSLWIANETR